MADAGGRIPQHPLGAPIPALPPAIGWLVAPARPARWPGALAGLTPGAGRARAAAALLGRACPSLLLPVSAGSWPGRRSCPLTSRPPPAAGAALLVVALAPVPSLLRAPTGGPVAAGPRSRCSALAGLAGAYPGARRPRAALERTLALGALGAWWTAARGAPARPHAVLRHARRDAGPAGFDGGPGITAGDLIAPLVSSGAPLLAPLWALAALVLPWVVRGRTLQVDIVGAAMWGAALRRRDGVGVWLGDRAGQAEPRGLVLGAIAAGALAVGTRARPPAEAADGPS